MKRRATRAGLLIGRLVASALKERVRITRRVPPDSDVLPGLDTRPAPMPPLHPPAAINDNPLAGIEEAVERELRAGGYLN